MCAARKVVARQPQQIGQGAQELAGEGRRAISSSGWISSGCPSVRSVSGECGADGLRHVPQLIQVEVEAAVKRFHDRPELGLRRHQVAEEQPFALG